MLVATTDDVVTESINKLEERIAELEQDNNEKDMQIEALTKKVEEQEIQITIYKHRERQRQQSRDKSVEDMCLLLELQHRDLIRQQLRQVEETFVPKSNPSNTRMIIINPSKAVSLLNSNHSVNCNNLEGNVTISNFDPSTNQGDDDVLPIEINCHTEEGSGNIKPCVTENVIGSAEGTELLNNVSEGMLQQTFTQTLDGDRLQIENNENTNNELEEPLHKKRKTSVSIECQNL